MTFPSIGFGTAPYRAGRTPVDVESAVRIALQAGYRLFDLAEAYGNERAVGRALGSADAPPRSEVHLVGKVWRTNVHPARLRRACEASLARLGIDHFDLYLLHAPGALRHVAALEDAEEIGWSELVQRATPRDELGNLAADEVPLSETWGAMRDLVSAGLSSRIGVSNFTIDEIDALGTSPPAANQIACWPFDALAIEAHRRRGITLFVYSPLKREILDTQPARAVSAAHGGSPAQVVLRWLIARGLHPLTSSTNPEHIRDSLGALEIELSPEEMNALHSAFTPQRQRL